MDINVATFVVAAMTFFAAVVGVYLAFMQIVRQDRDREERLDELERQQIIEHHRIHDRAVNAYQITGWEAMPPEWIVEWRQQHPRRKRSLLDRIRRR